MFERYTETARRALFFARYEASQVGSATITTELLLLGIGRSDKPLIAHLLGAGAPDDLRRDVERGIRSNDRKVSTSVEIPFDYGAKRALQYAAEEADRLQHRHIGTEHLILAILREEKSDAAVILMNHGLQLAAAREAVAKLVAEGPDRSQFPLASETSSLSEGLNQILDRLSPRVTDNVRARTLLEEIRERVAALERELGDRPE